MRRIVWLVAGAALTAAAMGIGGLVVVETGAYDVRASTPHRAIVAWATHTTMIHSLKRGADGVQPPAAFTPAETLAGMQIYEQQCMECHGGPGVPRAHWVQGMNPSPPFLVDVSRHWTRGQLFWVVKNGVKMTGMPAWEFTDGDGRIWDVVAFLEAMPDMKPAAFQAIVSKSKANPAVRSPSGPGRQSPAP